MSGNPTVNGTTTTIDTAVTDVDSIAVDGAGTFGGSVTMVNNNSNINRSDSGYIFEGGQTGSFTSRIFADGAQPSSATVQRRLGINAHNAATYTLVAGDAGKLVKRNNKCC